MIASILSVASRASLSCVSSKFKSFRNVGFDTVTEHYSASVVPLMDYGSAVCGYKNVDNS